VLLHLIASLRPRYEGDAGGGGTGGGNPSPTPAPAPAPPSADDRPNVQGLLQRHNNDAMAALLTVLTENHSLRDERRQLRGQLPAQGAVVLSPEQATTWQTYQQLGAPAEVQTALGERETVQKELATLRQDLVLRDVAGAARYDLDVLRTLGGSLTYVIKDEPVNGKPAKVAYVKEPGAAGSGGDKETPLDKYAEATWAKFLPSLKLADATTQRPAIGTPQARTPQQQQQPAQGVQPRKTTVRL
jgi:hypothetical protein